MQDKIQEIMGLVVKHGEVCCERNELGNIERESEIESKLRELVREPLSADERKELIADMDSPEQLILSVERIHDITNTSGVE